MLDIHPRCRFRQKSAKRFYLDLSDLPLIWHIQPFAPEELTLFKHLNILLVTMLAGLRHRCSPERMNYRIKFKFFVIDYPGATQAVLFQLRHGSHMAAGADNTNFLAGAAGELF